MNPTVDRLRVAVEEGRCSGGGAFRKWVSLMSDSDRFDIDDDRVSCRYAIADFMATFRGDAVVVEPATFRFASQMVAHAVVGPATVGDRCSFGGRVQIAVHRQAVRCARPYLFAYVDGRHYEVMGVSDAFTFTHRDGQCDCGNGEGDGSCGDATTRSPTTVADHPIAGRPTGDLVPAVVDDPRTSKALLRCSACKVPSNHREVLAKLMETVNYYSSHVINTIDNEYVKQTECLKNCNLALEYQYFKINMLTGETEDCQRFVDGLISSLLKNHKATFRVGDNVICVKRQRNSANERFMQSIINFQKETIANLSTTHKKLLILINITQLFSKVM